MQPGSQLPTDSASIEVPAELPTSHQTLSTQEVASFSDWLEPELQALEAQFREFWTPSSFKKSLSR